MAEGKLIRQNEIPISIGKPSADIPRRWLRQQIPYKNFAGMHDGLDQAVTTWVSNHRERFRSRMSQTMDRWATNWAAANGEALWHENEDDVHVPETKKAIDSKVARIEEALLDFDPIFEVEGKNGELSRYKGQVIASYVHRLMDLAQFRDYVQPAARDAELCNIAAVKVRWDHTVDLAVERNIELAFRADGTPYYKDERRMREAVVKSGPSFHLVDPFWFFYDLDAGRVQDCEFIGDESEVFFHDLESQARSGLYSESQVKLVKERRSALNNNWSLDGKRAELPDMYRQSRMVALGPDLGRDNQGEHKATRVRMVECWGWFDFGDGYDGVVDPLGQRLRGSHRIVATIANGVCVRFQLNPYDKKFVPYAVSRINRNGHEMVAPSQFDHVVQLNAQYDLVQSNILRMLSLSVAPVIITQNDTDLPDTILGVIPGSVLRATGNWDVVKMPEMPANSISYYHQYFRREIEEASGALRVFESPQGTATETERKVQEQQRMVRNSIRANGELWKQVALLTYWMSGQFATQPERFAVSGKASSLLGKQAMITPDILQEDVDFMFLGLQSLHTYGTRQAGMRQWMSNWGPMLASMPSINWMALARQDFELSVGRHNVNEVFTDAVPPWDTMPQEEENAMLLSGHPVAISKQDDDEEHMSKLIPLLNKPDIPAYIAKLLVDHFNQHLAQLQEKMAQQAAQEQEMRRQQMLQQSAGGVPGVDRPPPAGGMEAQAKTGTTNGPVQARTVSRTGRAGDGMSQTQAVPA
jgi:hypothetical protein